MIPKDGALSWVRACIDASAKRGSMAAVDSEGNGVGVGVSDSC